MLNFIVHLGSGKGKGGKALKKILRYCYKNKLDFTVHITGSKGHATRIATALCENNSKTIIAVGGDGTFHEVLNGITTFETTALGFIPAGRGNDFARCQGIPLKPIKALKKILAGEIANIDYIRVGDKLCLNTCGTGLDVTVLKAVEGKKGRISYLMGVIGYLFKFKPHKISVINEGIRVDYEECVVIGICNGKQIGSGIKISPDSITDDGLLNVVIVTMPKNKKLIRFLPKFVKGKHLNLDVTTHYLTTSIEVEPNGLHVQLDGEIYPDLEFKASVVPQGLKTFKVSK